MKGYKIFAIQKSVRDKADKSSSVSFDTLEISTNDFCIIRENNGVSGTLVFMPEDSSDYEVISGKKPEQKSLSKRLYDAMRDYYANKNGNLIGFEEFRTNYIEKKIKQFRGEK